MMVQEDDGAAGELRLGSAIGRMWREQQRRLGGQRVKVLSSTIGEGMKIAIRDE